ncbi:hypothetical protein HDU91_003953 [Kappamyces sp. JEL0680]|nr:hypothetical protein HDU91_003953 [Kappamyces sp. JEL0680]
MNQLISQFFGDPAIQLSCPVAGECMHYTQVPGYNRPDFRQGFPLSVIILLSVAAIVFVVAGICGVSYLKRRAESIEYSPLTSEAIEDGLQRRRDLMSHHTPCTVTFRNTGYVIETNKKVTETTAEPDHGLREDSSGESINLEFAPSESASAPGTKMKQVVLEGIQGEVKPGEVMAIMGGSGAGKTTLLDILARKNKSGTVTGDILVNGSFMDYEKYRNITGYVDQEDTLMDTLTVYETIMYSALLRLPRAMSLQAKQRRVQETMAELGIVHIANKRIGSSGNRGLSGGEKRRVSIACELVTSPSILFLDEPTSGLDSYNAYNVIECLVGLARDYQRCVIFTIHQPRSNIYALFDQLVLLSKGRVVYSGPAQQPALEHFSKIGYECPLGFNIADYLVDLTMHAANSSIDNLVRDGDTAGWPPADSASEGRPGSPTLKVSIRTQQENLLFSPKSPAKQGKGKSIPDSRTATLSRPQLDPDLILTEQTPVRLAGEPQPMSVVTGNLIKPYISDELASLIRGYESSVISKTIKSDIESSLSVSYPNATSSDLETLRRRSGRNRLAITQEGVPSLSSTVSRVSLVFSNEGTDSGRFGANWSDQFKILSGRTFKNLYRNPDLLLTQYAISVVLAIVCGLLFWKVDDTLSGFQNRLGVMFFVCALFGFGCLSSMQAFASERLIFVRERANRYYSPITYFTAKVMFDIIPLRVVPPLILGLICYHMIGLQPELYMLFRFLLVLILFNVTSASCCLMLSIIFKDQGVASLIATLVMLFEMLFGGLLLNKATMAPSYQWLQNLSFFNYAFEALVVNEVAGLTLVEEKFGFKIDVPGALVLQTFGLNAQGYWTDVQSLGIMCSTFLVISPTTMGVLAVEDFLDRYTGICSRKKIPTISFLVDHLQNAINSGDTVESLRLKGNSPDLQKTRISDEVLDSIVSALPVGGFLRVLDLSYNEIGNKGAFPLAKFIKDDNLLEVLILKSNNIGGSGMLAICEAMQVNSKINYLDVSSNAVEEEGGMAIASMLQVNNGLANLFLSGCSLKATSIIAIATVLQSNNCIQQLDISNNALPSSSLSQSLVTDIMTHLSMAIRINTGIKILDLSKMGINDFAMVNLFGPALAANATLESLNLSRIYLDFNRITGKGLQAIAQSLAQNAVLSHIALWGNQWDAPSSEDFCKLLGGPSSTVTVNPKAIIPQQTVGRFGPNSTDVTFTRVEGVLEVAHGKLRTGLDASTQETPFSVIGECEDMCPEYEREERQSLNLLSEFEMADGSRRADPAKMVKQYKRSAAGDPTPLPCDIRPPRVLLKVLDYLLERVVKTHGVARTHAFVSDRTRAIRNDLTLQNSRGAEAVVLHERIARYHIMSLNDLCSVQGFGLVQEVEQLQKTLLSLMEFYREMKEKSIDMPNEAEFSAYYVLLFPWGGDVPSKVESEVRPAVFVDHQVQLALKLRFLLGRCDAKHIDGSLRHYSRVLSILRMPATPYLVSCCVHIHLAELRTCALAAMQRSYNFVQGKPASGMKLADLVEALGFDDEQEAVRFLQHYYVDVAKTADGQFALIGRMVRTAGQSGRQNPKFPFVEHPPALALARSGTWPNMNDSTIENRLLYSNRAFKTLYKKFQEADSLDAFLVELESTRYLIGKQEQIQRMTMAELNNLNEEKTQKENEIENAKLEIQQLKLELAIARQKRQERLEYDEIASDILKIASRQKSQSCERDMDIMQEQLQSLDHTIRFRKNQLHSLISHIHEIQNSIAGDGGLQDAADKALAGDDHDDEMEVAEEGEVDEVEMNL